MNDLVILLTSMRSERVGVRVCLARVHGRRGAFHQRHHILELAVGEHADIYVLNHQSLRKPFELIDLFRASNREITSRLYL